MFWLIPEVPFVEFFTGFCYLVTTMGVRMYQIARSAPQYRTLMDSVDTHHPRIRQSPRL